MKTYRAHFARLFVMLFFIPAACGATPPVAPPTEITTTTTIVSDTRPAYVSPPKPPWDLAVPASIARGDTTYGISFAYARVPTQDSDSFAVTCLFMVANRGSRECTIFPNGRPWLRAAIWHGGPFNNERPNDEVPVDKWSPRPLWDWQSPNGKNLNDAPIIIAPGETFPLGIVRFPTSSLPGAGEGKYYAGWAIWGGGASGRIDIQLSIPLPPI